MTWTDVITHLDLVRYNGSFTIDVEKRELGKCLPFAFFRVDGLASPLASILKALWGVSISDMSHNVANPGLRPLWPGPRGTHFNQSSRYRMEYPCFKMT